jgi:rfaE bifunctional protein kinase chain/domain
MSDAMHKDLSQWIPHLAGKRILVIGDVILDEYITGSTTRLSREAPIPVLEFESRQIIPGGAANPAVNITALGSTALQLGLIGADAAGDTLRESLQSQGIDPAHLVIDPDRPTTVKLRILAQMGLRFPQQVARLDTLSREPVNGKIATEMLQRYDALLPSVDAVLVSDYHGGLLTPSLVQAIREHSKGTLLTVDAQGQLDKYRGYGVVKCNAADAESHLSRDLNTDADFAAAARELLDTLQVTRAVVITRGREGATLASVAGPVRHCPAATVHDVYDVVGAGDTAIAVLTLALAAGADDEAALTLANYASGIVIQRVGNYSPSPEELRRALQNWGISPSH